MQVDIFLEYISTLKVQIRTKLSEFTQDMIFMWNKEFTTWKEGQEMASKVVP